MFWHPRTLRPPNRSPPVWPTASRLKCEPSQNLAQLLSFSAYKDSSRRVQPGHDLRNPARRCCGLQVQPHRSVIASGNSPPGAGLIPRPTSPSNAGKAELLLRDRRYRSASAFESISQRCAMSAAVFPSANVPAGIPAFTDAGRQCRQRPRTDKSTMGAPLRSGCRGVQSRDLNVHLRKEGAWRG